MEPGRPHPAPFTRAVVTGGSGFIGRHLCRSLLDRGVSVVNVDIAAPPPSLADCMVTLPWDIRRPLPDPPDAARHADVVVHLAAIAREPGFPDPSYDETNAAGTAHVLDWCTRAGVDRLWFTSSMSVYGPSETPLDETAELVPRTAYGRSKVAAESLVRQWLEGAPARRAVVVRPAVVFGPGEGGNFTRLARALRRRRFVYPGRSDTIKASVYVEELIASMWFLNGYQAEGGPAHLLANIAYPESSTLRDICEVFHAVGGLPRPLGTIPLPLMTRTAAVMARLQPSGDVAPLRIEKLVRSTNVYPGTLLSLGYRFESDLRSGVQRWYEAEPRGQFV